MAIGLRATNDETQKRRDTEATRHRSYETQKLRDTEATRHRTVETGFELTGKLRPRKAQQTGTTADRDDSEALTEEKAMEVHSVEREQQKNLTLQQAKKAQSPLSVQGDCGDRTLFLSGMYLSCRGSCAVLFDFLSFDFFAMFGFESSGHSCRFRHATHQVSCTKPFVHTVSPVFIMRVRSYAVSFPGGFLRSRSQAGWRTQGAERS